MSNLIVFDLANPGTPKESKALPERLVEGDPSYRTWEQDIVDGGRIRSGIWEATPGATLSMGRVGNLTLDDNLEGAMANPFIFDKTNIDQYSKIY